ncbi:MAG: bifunctional metallophosphatase/5'-nucleotidase [Comamonas sp.]
MRISNPLSLSRSKAQTLSCRYAVLASVALLLAACAQTPPPAAPVQLRLIAFNDFHGNLEETGLSLSLPDPAQPGKTVRLPTGGAAALAGTVVALRTAAPQYSAVISSGDLIGAAPLPSSLFRHESTVAVMNQIGIDVAIPGNHEFDAGVAELERMVKGGCGANEAHAGGQSCAIGPYQGMRFPVVAANVERVDGTPLFAPSQVLSYGGIRVGFIGAVTKTTPSIVVPSGVAGVRFIDEAEAINREARRLKQQGVQALVAILHEGGETGGPGVRTDWNDASCPGARGAIFDILPRISQDVDLVFTAHTHQGYRCVIDGRPVLQATSYGRGLSVADVVLDPKTGEIDRARTFSSNVPVFNARTDAAQRASQLALLPAPYAQALRDEKPDAAIAQQVASYVALAAPRANQPVGRIGGNFERRAGAESSLGRLVADAQLAATRAPERGGAQVSLMNPGGIRADLVCRNGPPPCTVTYGDSFSVHPFGNSLVVMTLSGRQLKALLESQQPAGATDPIILSPSRGFGYRWSAQAAPGERVSDLRLNGQPIGPDQEIRVVVNSFLADGGDGFVVLKDGTDRVGGALDLDALKDYLSGNPVPVAEARVLGLE